MEQKLAELQDTVDRDHNGNNPIKPLVDKMVDKDVWQDCVALDPVILENNGDLAKIFATLEFNDQSLENKDRFRMHDCIDLLSNRAYNDSLGVQHDDPKWRSNHNAINVKKDLRNAGINPDDSEAVEEELDKMLKQIARANHISRETLIKLVNYALYNEGIYGIRDAAGYFERITNSPIYKPPGYNDMSTWPHVSENTGVGLTGTIGLEYMKLLNSQKEMSR